jgi:hypothetical protein
MRGRSEAMRLCKWIGILCVGAWLLFGASAPAEEGGHTAEAKRLDEILKAYSKANEKVKASSLAVDGVARKRNAIEAKLKRGEKVSEGEIWDVKEEFVNVLLDQYSAFNNLRKYEYSVVGALKRYEYSIYAKGKYLRNIITEIDSLIDRYKMTLQNIDDKIDVESNVHGKDSARVVALKKRRKTVDYMHSAYKKFGIYASKMEVIHKRRAKQFSEKVKAFGERVGQLPHIVDALKKSLRLTFNMYKTKEMLEVVDIPEDVRNFLKTGNGFGEEFEKTLDVMAKMPDIFMPVPVDVDKIKATDKEKKELEKEFKEIEKKYK